MPRVHRAVHVAHKVDQHLQLHALLGRIQIARLETGDQVVYGLQHVAPGIGCHALERLARIDVQIVPRLRIGILGRVAGVVEPVGIVDGRVSAEDLVDAFGRLGRQVAFGYVGRHVVSLLPPRRGTPHGQQAGNQ